ncbi:SMP-30/gluconolactonase/LRE family protein [Gryllotalpicola protaetiae]|uniref:SMP-30/gluconolactonase/LRE family protein n=1 Tax=Gryllotalpicola protaetiae TaxID=2419771 RepID=A0A387BN23_9MICO|nr:SMP-30/gluconolactonase/LRE family protein [Gryllotalpicola protaetiae]AYG04098.1 SMP-30/gluconolactonase/LRE family protein [Gryllotalpicola protaetiae]
MRAEQLTAPVTWHGEGPCWDPVGERMLVVDMLAGAVVDLSSLESPARHSVGSPVAAVVRPRADGGFIVATEHGFSLFDSGFRRVCELAQVLDDPAIRLNEGGCDAAGRFFCGSMAYDETPGAASLYRVTPDGSASVVLDGVTISNGLQWSLDGSRAYYVDTPTHRVDVFDYSVADGELSERRPFADVSGFDGAPDGMTIDAEGGLWVAFWGGGVIRRLDPESGAVTEEVSVPGASHTSAAAFGGASLDTLYITTSRQHLPDDAEPRAGSVFAVQPGVRGVALPVFGG